MAAYQGVPNQFRKDLIAGKQLIGCWSHLANPITAEILGLAGYDWILLDGEHSPNDITTFVPQLMALKDSSSAPIVRPPWNDVIWMKRLLDAGFYNFLIPYVESAEQAKQAVASTRYPTAGIRGVALATRQNKYGTIPDFLKQINDCITLLVQIESQGGVANLEKIAAVDGVDGVFVGPADLAASMGHLGNPSHPEVQAVIKDLFTRIKAAGKPAGTLALNEADARRYMEWGASFVAVGSDQGIFRDSVKAVREKFK
ncbi:2-dehydro-3-deoxyglucarate aldolase [Usitatibacter palustris]|uniref:5-keto-4-deoxy-D-glucarate aldolase n=1 Tax=Usitatibacter palustris TaxID=2732487 RepID=A0A6M4HDK3_9PROT|nr:2-dehydro-3-deoxyglucarate aldolase [Usitatibacter palustris]QJR16664.1 5-keto-4-deoxy-D-glucarate aldolase [Usitatibacter palustris]